jgi:hypothetical protein
VAVSEIDAFPVPDKVFELVCVLEGDRLVESDCDAVFVFVLVWLAVPDCVALFVTVGVALFVTDCVALFVTDCVPLCVTDSVALFVADMLDDALAELVWDILGVSEAVILSVVIVDTEALALDVYDGVSVMLFETDADCDIEEV